MSDFTVTFLREYFCFNAGQSVSFKKGDFTILYGDQGAGKTTLIKSFSSQDSLKKLLGKYIDIDGFNFSSQLYAESESFRVQRGSFILSRKDAEKIRLNDMSHGQAWRRFIDTLKHRQNQDALVTFDEPETSFSIDSILSFCELMLMLKRELKISAIIATHNPLIIEFLADRIIEVPTLKELDKAELLNSMSSKVERFRAGRINDKPAE